MHSYEKERAYLLDVALSRSNALLAQKIQDTVRPLPDRLRPLPDLSWWDLVMPWERPKWWRPFKCHRWKQRHGRIWQLERELGLHKQPNHFSPVYDPGYF